MDGCKSSARSMYVPFRICCLSAAETGDGRVASEMGGTAGAAVARVWEDEGVVAALNGLTATEQRPVAEAVLDCVCEA